MQNFASRVQNENLRVGNKPWMQNFASRVQNQNRVNTRVRVKG